MLQPPPPRRLRALMHTQQRGQHAGQRPLQLPTRTAPIPSNGNAEGGWRELCRAWA